MYAQTRTIFEDEWESLGEKYGTYDPEIYQYLNKVWVGPYKRKFIKCWTDQITHFNNTATSRSESGHAVLKRELKFSTGDLETVVKNIENLLSRQRRGYLDALGKAKTRVPDELREPWLCDVLPLVTPFALRLCLKQKRKIGEALEECTHAFTTTTGLPCAHKIKERIDEDAGVLKIDDIHSHWRFEKPLAMRTRNPPATPDDLAPAIDPLLAVREPRIAVTKGRPTGQQELPTRAELELQRSTTRDPSQFERVDRMLEARNRARAPAITASQVAQEATDAEADTYFRLGGGGGIATSTPTSQRLLAQPARRWGGGRARHSRARSTTPAFMAGNEAIFGQFQL